MGVHCELYNAALEERRGAWAWERRSVTYVDQTRTLTELRALRPEVLACGVTVCRGTLKRLDRAFAAFYRRCRAGPEAGVPPLQVCPPLRLGPVGGHGRLALEDRTGPALPLRHRPRQGPAAPSVPRHPQGHHRPPGGAPLVGEHPLRRRAGHPLAGDRPGGGPRPRGPLRGGHQRRTAGGGGPAAHTQRRAPGARPTGRWPASTGGRVTGPGRPPGWGPSTARWPISGRTSPTSCRGRWSTTTT